jgi:hypothetical protein
LPEASTFGYKKIIAPKKYFSHSLAMQLTAGRSVTNFWDDFHIEPAAKLALSQR